MVYVLCVIFGAAALVMTVKYINGKRQIRNLSVRIDKVLSIKDYENVGKFEKYTEGDLAVLENEIDKLVGVLREQAENLMKDKVYLADSIADISHQLKTPLTSINIVLSMLMDTELTAGDRMGYVEELMRLSGRIDWLVQTLLKISGLDADTVQFEETRVEFSELINQVRQGIEIPMDIKGQQLVEDIEEGSGFYGDMGWSVEAVTNILKNCMEHMKDGGKIYIKTEENPLYSSIVIEDEGNGIDSEDLGHIFERFYRGKSAKDTSVGIGLHLARTIITRQNGTIKAGNRDCGGACFEVRFNKQIV